MKRILAIITACTLLICFAIGASGCENYDDYSKLSLTASALYGKTSVEYASGISVSETVKKLDGQPIVVSGYMAGDSPLDGSFIFVVTKSNIACVYCSGESGVGITALFRSGASKKLQNLKSATRYQFYGTLVVGQQTFVNGSMTYDVPFVLYIDAIKS